MMLQENNTHKNILILELMLSKISKYFDSKIYINDLIQDLEIYLDQLSLVENEWKIHFRTIWFDIEVAYSLALDKGLDKPENEGNAIINDSLNILKKMIIDKLDNLKKDS